MLPIFETLDVRNRNSRNRTAVVHVLPRRGDVAAEWSFLPHKDLKQCAAPFVIGANCTGKQSGCTVGPRIARSTDLWLLPLRHAVLVWIAL